MDRPNIFEQPGSADLGGVRDQGQAAPARGRAGRSILRQPGSALTQSCCVAQRRAVRNNHMDHFPMRATEELDYSTTICCRCGDRERLIVKTRNGVVSRCYVCGDAATWVTAARATAPTGTVRAQTAAATSST